MKPQFRRVILVMLTLAMIINYLDRSALAYAMPFITKDFHLTPEEKGIIFGSFSIGYALFNFIGGVLADKFGPKRVFSWSMVIWSVICGLTAGCFNFWTMFIARAFFGAGEGPISTTANKVVNNWFPLNERARAVGINQAGGPFGGAISGPIVGFLCLTFNWRVSFVIIAFIGITWAIIWTLVATDKPRGNKRVCEEEVLLIEGETVVEEIETAPVIAGEKPSMWTAILQPSILATALSLFCFNYVLFFFMNWFPSFLVDTTGISLKDMSLVGVLPWVAGTLGYTSGGFIIDMIYKKTGKQLFSRKVVLVTSFTICSVCVGLISQTQTAMGAVVLMTISFGFMQLAAPAYWTLIQDAAPKEYVGSAGGLMHGLANISGIVAPTVTGFIVGAGSYSSAFILAGCLGILGATVVALFVKKAGDKVAHNATA
ncbi:MFS transporter [Kluyvera intermedia]|uniref:MFS transporter n=1 Tax=Kluyvera intermedia TaxID=61648 RepID=A0ABX3UKH3_KLUIN|nr:MFS transporter [Kluyvera intermedia]ORJ51834.1 MFS transporter [Kluyvera intermedia]